MERLKYDQLLHPFPIRLSFGTLRKPTLKEISEITFSRYYFYQLLAGLTPKLYFEELRKEQKGKEYWDSLSEEEQNSIKIITLISADPSLCEIFLDMLNFFIVEPVIYYNNLFIILNDSETDEEIDLEDESVVKGIINNDEFEQLLLFLRQICCVDIQKKEEEEPVFKNEIARKMYEKMKKADEIKSIHKNLDLTLPNIISKISNKHPSINPINVWDLTAFQLLDSFGCLQCNVAFDIQKTRVAVWGDEKNKFDITLWYKNTFENSNTN